MDCKLLVTNGLQMTYYYVHLCKSKDMPPGLLQWNPDFANLQKKNLFKKSVHAVQSLQLLQCFTEGRERTFGSSYQERFKKYSHM